MIDTPLKVLMIAAHTPPQVRPQAILLGKLLRHLPRHDLDINLLTAAKGYDSEGVNVAGYQARGRLFSSVMMRLFSGDFWLQTSMIHGKAFAQVKRIQAERRIDVAMSFANPYAVNVLGAQLSRKYELPFIAHYSDPFVGNPYHDISTRVQKGRLEAERKVLAQATAVVFVNERLKEWVLDRHPDGLVRRVEVISHSFEKSLFPDRVKKEDKSKILVRHIGALYGPRNGHTFLEALTMLRRDDPNVFSQLTAEFIGPDLYGVDGNFQNEIQRRELEGTVVIRPILPYVESLKEMAQADLLLNIDAGEGPSIFLTSKLIDYLGAGKPILCLTQTDSPSYVLCRRVGAAVADVNSPENIAAVIQQFIAEGGKQRLDARHVADFTIGKISQDWANLFRTVARGQDK